MTAEERIALCTEASDLALTAANDVSRKMDARAVNAQVATAFELRALRLMLREEIREAAWPLKQLQDARIGGASMAEVEAGLARRKRTTGMLAFEGLPYDPLASRKAPPLEDKPCGVAMEYTPEQARYEWEQQALASRKAPPLEDTP